MRIAAQFDPTASATNSGTFNTQIPAGSLLRLLVINQSPANLILAFANGYTDYVIAQDRRFFQVQASNGNVSWTVDSFIGNTIQGVTQVVCIVYEVYESLAESYPASIVNSASPKLVVATLDDTVNPTVTLTGRAGKQTYLLSFIATAKLAAAKRDVHIAITVTGSSNNFNFDWYESDIEATQFEYHYDEPLPTKNINQTIQGVITNGTAPVTFSLIGFYQ